MSGGKTKGANIPVLHNTDMCSLVSAQERMANTSVMHWFPVYAVRSGYAGMISECVQRHVQRRGEKHEYADAEAAATSTTLALCLFTSLLLHLSTFPPLFSPFFQKKFLSLLFSFFCSSFFFLFPPFFLPSPFLSPFLSLSPCFSL